MSSCPSPHGRNQGLGIAVMGFKQTLPFVEGKVRAGTAPESAEQILVIQDTAQLQSLFRVEKGLGSCQQAVKLTQYIVKTWCVSKCHLP